MGKKVVVKVPSRAATVIHKHRGTLRDKQKLSLRDKQLRGHPGAIRRNREVEAERQLVKLMIEEIHGKVQLIRGMKLTHPFGSVFSDDIFAAVHSKLIELSRSTNYVFYTLEGVKTTWKAIETKHFKFVGQLKSRDVPVSSAKPKYFEDIDLIISGNYYLFIRPSSPTREKPIRILKDPRNEAGPSTIISERIYSTSGSSVFGSTGFGSSSCGSFSSNLSNPSPSPADEGSDEVMEDSQHLGFQQQWPPEQRMDDAPADAIRVIYLPSLKGMMSDVQGPDDVLLDVKAGLIPYNEDWNSELTFALITCMVRQIRLRTTEISYFPDDASEFGEDILFEVVQCFEYVLVPQGSRFYTMTDVCRRWLEIENSYRNQIEYISRTTRGKRLQPVHFELIDSAIQRKYFIFSRKSTFPRHNTDHEEMNESDHQNPLQME